MVTHIKLTISTILSLQFTNVKCIHIIVKQISRTFFILYRQNYIHTKPFNGFPSSSLKLPFMNKLINQFINSSSYS